MVVVNNRFNLLFLIILMINMSACSSSSNIRIISSDDFKREYQNSKILHTMTSYKLLNVKNGRICLEKKEISSYNQAKWDKEIICTQLE